MLRLLEGNSDSCTLYSIAPLIATTRKTSLFKRKHPVQWATVSPLSGGWGREVETWGEEWKFNYLGLSWMNPRRRLPDQRAPPTLLHHPRSPSSCPEIRRFVLRPVRSILFVIPTIFSTLTIRLNYSNRQTRKIEIFSSVANVFKKD